MTGRNLDVLTLADLNPARPRRERRRECRVGCRRVLAVLLCDDPDASGFRRVRLEDCSPRGIAIITRRPIQPGQQLLARLKLRRMMVAVYTVLHCTRMTDSQYKIGASLTDVIGPRDGAAETPFAALLENDSRHRPPALHF